jgi:hypothetical protein
MKYSYWKIISELTPDDPGSPSLTASFLADGFSVDDGKPFL